MNVPKPQGLRILVLEAGPFTFLEHVQDIPNLQIKNPNPVQADKTTLLDVPSPPRMLTADNALPATRQAPTGQGEPG